MPEAMVSQVVDGAVNALKTAFPGLRVYTEAVAQGLEAPCFSVKCISTGLIPRLGSRYLKTHLLRIYYFPGGDEPWREVSAVLEDMLPALEIISCGGAPTRGANINARIEDDVGVCTLNYDFFVRRVRDEESMQEIEIMEVNIT